MIEQVEHLEHPVDLPVAAKRQCLLEPHVHTVERIAHEAGARDNRPVPAEPGGADDADGAPFVAEVGAEVDPATLARTVEIDPTQLDAVSEVPNAVEDGPMALVSPCRGPSSRICGGQAFAAEILGQGKADRPSRHDTVAADVPLIPNRIGIHKPRQRVSGRALPAVTEP